MSDSSLEALQRTLAAEHAADWLFATLGGRAAPLTDQALHDALDAAYDVHLQRRDRLRALVAGAGGDPVAAEPAYRLPSPLDTATRIEEEALRVERACAPTYAGLVAATAGAERRWAVDALIATAVGEADFGGRPEALPGLAAD